MVASQEVSDGDFPCLGNGQLQGTAHRLSDKHGPGTACPAIHGNSSSSGAYTRQIEGEIGRTLRLVALDLPGHGAPDRARDPAAAYALPGYARIMRTFTEHLDLREAVIVGWSFGGHIALEAAPDLPDARGLLVFGTPLFAGLAMPTLWRGAVQELTGAGHAPQWETPDEFDALLGAFVADCQRN